MEKFNKHTESVLNTLKSEIEKGHEGNFKSRLDLAEFQIDNFDKIARSSLMIELQTNSKEDYKMHVEYSFEYYTDEDQEVWSEDIEKSFTTTNRKLITQLSNLFIAYNTMYELVREDSRSTNSNLASGYDCARNIARLMASRTGSKTMTTLLKQLLQANSVKCNDENIEVASDDRNPYFDLHDAQSDNSDILRGLLIYYFKGHYSWGKYRNGIVIPAEYNGGVEYPIWEPTDEFFNDLIDSNMPAQVIYAVITVVDACYTMINHEVPFILTYNIRPLDLMHTACLDGDMSESERSWHKLPLDYPYIFDDRDEVPEITKEIFDKVRNLWSKRETIFESWDDLSEDDDD